MRSTRPSEVKTEGEGDVFVFGDVFGDVLGDVFGDADERTEDGLVEMPSRTRATTDARRDAAFHADDVERALAFDFDGVDVVASVSAPTAAVSASRCCWTARARHASHRARSHR